MLDRILDALEDKTGGQYAAWERRRRTYALGKVKIEWLF
jgi:hypothetical protein